MVQKVINDAKVIFAAAEGNFSSDIQETSTSVTPLLDMAGSIFYWKYQQQFGGTGVKAIVPKAAQVHVFGFILNVYLGR